METIQQVTYDFPNLTEVGVLDIFGPMRINSQAKVPDIVNWGHTSEAALQVQGASVVTGASVNLGFVKHSANVTRVWDQYGLIGDFGGTSNRFLDPTPHDSSPMVLSGGLPVYKFSGIQVGFTAPNVVTDHLSTIEIASEPIFDDTKLHPGGVWALNVSGGKARFAGGIDSLGPTMASVVIVGGASIAGTVNATSFSQGGALTISGGVGISGNAMIKKGLIVGSDVAVSGNIGMIENSILTWGSRGQITMGTSTATAGSTMLISMTEGNALKLRTTTNVTEWSVMNVNGSNQFTTQINPTTTSVLTSQQMTLTTKGNLAAQMIMDPTNGITFNDTVNIANLRIGGTNTYVLSDIVSTGGGVFGGPMYFKSDVYLGTSENYIFSNKNDGLSIESVDVNPKLSLSKMQNNLFGTSNPEMGIYSLGGPEAAHAEALKMVMDGTNFSVRTTSWGQGSQRSLLLTAHGTYTSIILATDGSMVLSRNISIGNQGVVETQRPITINDVTKVADYGSTLGGALNVMGDVLVRNRLFFNAISNSLFSAPKTGSRSRGTRVVLDPKISPVNVDSAIGCENLSQWYSVPNASYKFDWYNGITKGMSLMNGDLVVSKSIAIGNTTSQVVHQVDSGGSQYSLTWPTGLPSNTIKAYLSCDADGKLDWDNSILNDGNLLVNGVVLSNSMAYQTTLTPSTLMDENYGLVFPPTLPPNAEQQYLASDTDGNMKWVTAIGQNSPQIPAVMDYDSGAVSLGSDFNFSARMYVSFYIILLPQYLDVDGTLVNYPMQIDVKLLRNKYASTRTYQQANWTTNVTSNQAYSEFINFQMIGSQLYFTTSAFKNNAFIPYTPPTTFNVVYCSPITMN